MITSKDKPKVLWLNIDGLKPEVFYHLLDAGRLPNLGKIFRNGRRAERAASVFPTVTMPCQASLATGAFPGKHLIIGNGWFDRMGKEPIFRNYTNPQTALDIYGYRLFGFPTGILPEKRGIPLGSRDISGATPTMYAILKSRSVRSAVSFNQISRGAGEWIRPARFDVLQYKMCSDGKMSFEAFERTVARRAIDHIRSEKHLQRVLHLYFPGLDGYGHFNGPGSQGGYLEKTLDPIVGRIIGAISERHDPGEYYYVLSSDHGQGQTSGDPGHALGEDSAREMFSAIGRKLFMSSGKESPKKASAVAVMHGGAMHIYIRNQATRKWYDPPRTEEDLLETAFRLFEMSRRNFSGVRAGWLDIIIINDVVEGRQHVMDAGGVYELEDFFNSSGNREKYPDAVRRIRGLQCKRNADIIVLADYGGGFHFGRPDHRGQHGNLCADDSLVPMVFAGPGVVPGTFEGEVSIVDVAPTIASLYGAPMKNADGRVLGLFGK